MKYKVGDRVRIKSLDWYNENKNICNEIIFKNNSHWRFVADQSNYCGQIATITAVSKTAYHLESIPWNWTDEMIEGLVEHIDCEKCGLTFTSTRCLLMDNCPHTKQKNIIEIPEDYVLKDENGNVINATKIVLEKKKKEYPKTFEECCKILGVLNVDLCFNADYRSFDDSKEQWKRLGLMNQFYKLHICRDAYWKIAGEEMGLGKPWEPDWVNLEQDKHCIWVDVGDIILNEGYRCQHILTFPTAEMRDAFYENFKKEIEICKELL